MLVPEPLPPPRYALAHDRRTWAAQITALEPDADGDLTLARVPGPADGTAIELPPPYSLSASGIAAGPCGIIFVSDTAHHRIVIVERRCGTRAHLPISAAPGSAPGQFNSPRGLAVSPHALVVADSGNARVQHLALPALEPHLAWTASSSGLLQHPAGVSIDSAGRTYVLDETTGRVFRWDSTGAPDAAYDAALQAQDGLIQPVFLAIGAGDVLLVSDAGGDAVRVFDSHGSFSHVLPGPPGMSWKPRALAVSRGRIYVHDALSGIIHVYADSETYCCRLGGWRGPVTALAVDEDGNLLIKSGLDDDFVIFSAARGYAAEGELVYGPLDAGAGLEWLRAAVAVDTPPRARAQLDVAQFDSPAPPPSPSEWIAAPSLDTLLAPLTAAVPPSSRRWLWLRVRLGTSDPRVSPVLRQVRAETLGEDYLDYLPGVYRRTDGDAGPLSRLLQLARTEQGAVDEAIDAMPQLISPSFARTSTLRWLAEWLAFDLPLAADELEHRELIASAVRWHEGRGTPASLQAIIELHTGIRPAIVEGFTQRAVWMLDESSRLGFDTGLPAMDPDGLVVAEPPIATAVPPRCCPPTARAAVVGHAGPMPRDRFCESLFGDWAHWFDVIVPRHRARDEVLLAGIRRIVEHEKPAHTHYCLCVVEPVISVGFQARIGVDMIVGGSVPPLRLDGSRLGLTAVDETGARDVTRVGQSTSVGRMMLV